MPKYRNKKSVKNIRRQANRRKALKKLQEPNYEKIFSLVLFILFIAGIGLSFFNSYFAYLTLGFPFIVGGHIADSLSKAVFNKRFEYYSEYSDKSMEWTDILLSIPLIIIGIYPMFIIGELSDCYLMSDNWSVTIGFCR